LRFAAVLALVAAVARPAPTHVAVDRFQLERRLQGAHYQSEWVERSAAALDIEEDAANGTRFRAIHVGFAPDGRAAHIEGKLFSPYAPGTLPILEYHAERTDRHVHGTVLVHRSRVGLGADSTGTWDYDLAEHDVFLPFGTAGVDTYLHDHAVGTTPLDLKWVDPSVGPLPVSIGPGDGGHVLVELVGVEHHDYVLDPARRIVSGTVGVTMGNVRPTLQVVRGPWIAPAARKKPSVAQHKP